MAKSNKIAAQIYGYSVCLVAVITFLISITMLMNATIDLSDPMHSGWTPQGSPSLASFENYKMDVLKSSPAGQVPGDQIIQTMYEAAKADKIRSVKFQANRSFIIGGILIILSGVLFITHWRWIPKVSGELDLTREDKLSYAD